MTPSPEEQISPELVLVDPALRERLLRESLQQLLLESLEASRRLPTEEPPSPAAPAPAPEEAATRASRLRGRRRPRLSSALTASVFLALLVVLPSLAFLPPQHAPSLGEEPAAAPQSQTIAWPRDLDADYYVVELSLHTVVVKRITTLQPFVALTAGEIRPGRYSWRVLAGERAHPGGRRGPIAAGTVTVG